MDLAEFIPNALQYGISGLSAIVFLLAYNMLQVQNKREEPNPAMLKTIKSFMMVALIFSILAASSSFIEAYFGSGDEAGALYKKSLVLNATNSLSFQVKDSQQRHKFDNGSVSKSVGSFDTDAITEQMSEDEFNFRVLRLAVFNSISAFGGQKDILEESLENLELRRFSFTKGQINRVLAELETLIGLRYAWLDRTAIDQANNELTRPSASQVMRTASIALPENVWIFSDYPLGNTPAIVVNFETLEALKSELELLKNLAPAESE